MASESVGFVGLGIMGSRQAANLAKAGYELTVFNRTRERADAWVAEHGGSVAGSPREVAERSDIVITMVVDGAQVEQMLFGDDGALSGARDGTLTIMAGGTEADFARARPLFEVMGELVVHVGALGHGQIVKLINNAVAASNASTLAQALIVGRATGVDLEALERIMGASSGGSTMLGLKAKPMRTHDYATLFKLEHMLKDVRLCLEEGQAAGVPFPAAAGAREVLSAAMGRGLGDADFAAMVEVLEGLAGIRL